MLYAKGPVLYAYGPKSGNDEIGQYESPWCHVVMTTRLQGTYTYKKGGFCSKKKKSDGYQLEIAASMVHFFMINTRECSSKDADIVDILKDSLKGTLTNIKKRCFNGNRLYLPVLGFESEQCEPALANCFT